jgi:hypothetical protein
MRLFTTLVAILFLAASPALAQKAKTDKMADLRGTWTHSGTGGKVTLELLEHTLRCTISKSESVTVRVEAEYMITHDGFLLAMLHAKKNKGETAEDAFDRRALGCRVRKEGDALIVSGLKLRNNQDELCKIIEGSYMMKEPGAAKATNTSDPNARMTQLINQSEDMRRVELEFARFWLEEQAAKKKQASAEKK